MLDKHFSTTRERPQRLDHLFSLTDKVRARSLGLTGAGRMCDGCGLARSGFVVP